MTEKKIRQAREEDIPRLLNLLGQLSPAKLGEVPDQRKLEEQVCRTCLCA